ncbi:DUF262 domain-containing protein [Sphaerospermopsis sp. FACHB-1194]|nr:DUF262 domain-containing protein [Sphaerospermopsis sp. FACHB-1194]MBD2147188.1 DUF262 domain-containing protein [Sphaerospermopsis sp. FACHB-1194]
MNDKIIIKPDTIFLEDLLNDIANGAYKIPIFQREFVWKTSQMLELFDSILKGYPIGSLLFWNTTGYKTKDQIGPYKINKENRETIYVLDGFQRISTLFGALMNPQEFSTVNENELKDFLIYFDIRENKFIYIRNKKDKNIFSSPLYQIYDNRELFNLLRELDKENIPEIEKNQYIDNARNLHNILHKYKLPYVEIKGGDIKSAVEIFSRVNSTGTEISEDFMLSALSYNEKTGFFLNESITEFLNTLNVYNFDNLKRDTVLDCISTATGKIYYYVKIEELLKKQDLESLTQNVYIHIKKAVMFLYKNLCVIDIRLLPYPAQLIFISEYFRINPNPTSQELQLLKNWFWITTYSNYFTIYSISQHRTAYEIFCQFAKGENNDGIYRVNDDMEFTTAKYPSKLNFTGVRPKALQLFYLKSILGNSEPQDMEGIKEIFISSKKDRTPGNIILRLSSEFDQSPEKKTLANFINNSQPDVLEKHFIKEEMVILYNQGKIDDFVSQRDEYLKCKESKFVESLNIKYVD